MARVTVRQGDCISSIAVDHGFFWETVWNHAENAELKERRGDPNVLMGGDVVFVPERTAKAATGATDQRHRFRKKGVPAKLRLRILRERPPEEEPTQTDESTDTSPDDSSTEDPVVDATQRDDEPRANVPYVLDVDGRLTEGQTDGDGMIECSIPPNARSARLTLEPGTPQETVIPLQLGHTDPISEIRGVKERLANLGFDCGDRGDAMTPAFATALRAFQEKHGLEVTGQVDDATRERLREVHGS